MKFVKIQCLGFLVSYLFFNNFLYSLIDLEDHTQDFVLEVKKINIPGFPHAFNPSIIRYKDSLLLSFRNVRNPNSHEWYNSDLYLVWLDEEFNPKSKPQFLQTNPDNPAMAPRAEDARLVFINNRLHIVYSDNKEEEVTKGGFRVYIAEVIFDGKKFSLKNNECLLEYEDASPGRREKNWSPFDYEGNMMLAYSFTPHRILKPLVGTGKCETFATTLGDISWPWGEIRGGTPGILDEDHYLAFFHSQIKMESVHSNGKMMLHYFMGAYTFSKEPPFEITFLSPEPIIGKGFYHGANYKPYKNWGTLRVVFPCGFIMNHDFIWIAFGRQDHEMWISKIDKKALLKTLVPISKIQ
jgi:predicted GH43/DUF377 family glycosyl hydrolase